MSNETGYPDSVARQEPARTEVNANPRNSDAAPGHDGRSEDTLPIGPQSGFTPLESSQTPHGNVNTEESARKTYGRE